MNATTANHEEQEFTPREVLAGASAAPPCPEWLPEAIRDAAAISRYGQAHPHAAAVALAVSVPVQSASFASRPLLTADLIDALNVCLALVEEAEICRQAEGAAFLDQTVAGMLNAALAVAVEDPGIVEELAGGGIRGQVAPAGRRRAA